MGQARELDLLLHTHTARLNPRNALRVGSNDRGVSGMVRACVWGEMGEGTVEGREAVEWRGGEISSRQSPA